MKTKSTIALITALLLTSVGAYAQPMNNGQTNGRWDTNRTQSPQQRGQTQEQNRNDRNDRNNRNEGNRQQQTHDQRNNGNRPQQTHDQRNNDNRPQQTNNERNRNNGYNNGRMQNNQSRHTYQRGQRLPVDYRGSRGARYEVNDWHSHRNLYAPPSGARWILSVDGDYILASILTGVIYSIIH